MSAQSPARVPSSASGDEWIHSACYMCFSPCGIKVHRQNGVIVKIEGDQDCPHNLGRLCAKGQAGLMDLYDPNRVTSPLKRTNPNKGLGVDPKWQKITWQEALEAVSARLNAIRESDPRKLVMASWDNKVVESLVRPWASAFGTPNLEWMGYFCGQYLHSVMYLTNGTFHSDFDINYCNYVILLGNQMGFLAGLNPAPMSQRMAEARMRGMKVVVVDPVCTNAGSKADEWVPIRPGTDGALMLAMINVLVNELGIYDAGFLKEHTNGPYLVGTEGYYMKDATGKPLVWDTTALCARSYDAKAGELALEGEYLVQGTRCRPAFQLLKEHVKEYSPERAAAITTVPAATVRRLAREFGEAARIGSTIVIEGKELPYRPVAVNIYRGAGAHKHGVLTGLSVQLLNAVVGAMYAVGSHRGVNLVGPGGSWHPGKTEEGLVLPAGAIGHRNYYAFDTKAPDSLAMKELFPVSTNLSPVVQLSIDDPLGHRLPYVPEMLMVSRTSLMTNKVNPEQMAETLKKIPFIVVFSRLLEETTEFADIVLPDTHYLERMDLFPNSNVLSIEPSTGYWYWGLRQPVDRPVGEARSWMDVLLELADRGGFLESYLDLLNVHLGLKGPHKLDTQRKYAWDQIFDRWARSQFGEDKSLDWFKKHGYHKVARSVEETYPLPSLNVRFPIYYENVKRAGDVVKSISAELELAWDTSDYEALPDWKACSSHGHGDPERDLYVVNYKTPFHYQSWTTENPWLNEVGERHPYAYKVMINVGAASRKGIRDGDLVWIESEHGRVKGQAKVTECIHPEVVGIAGVFGSWAEGKPIARGKGVHFNSLFSLSKDRMDPISSGVDACLKVKVYRADKTAS